ncbi:MAG: HAD family phosphatase [Lachnospiraceae bacterium]|nr:HAD family phosphatase [Lachnospiraceae bacterium]
MTMKIEAVLFDMDGLVLDTEKLYTRFWVEAANALGYPMTVKQGLGMRSLNRTYGAAKLKSYFGEDVDYDQVRNKRIELMDAFVEKEGVYLKKGINELLIYLKDNNIKTAIATSSPIERTIKYLSSVNMDKRFDELVSGYMVEKGKPEPDIYLYAAKKLGVNPENCMVLEDSPAGILSGYKAGCIPVIVPDQDEPDEETMNRIFAKAKDLIDVIDIIEKINKGI